jgi:hypothetical protein
MTKLLKIFYSWYIFPICFIHEYLHIFACKITNTKVNSIIFYKNESGLYNGKINNELPTHIWKVYIIVYSPLLLILPLLLSFFSSISFYISLYIISTIIYKNGKIIWMALPSKNDILYINYWKNNRNLLLKFIKYDDLIKSIENNTYSELLKRFNIN